MDWNYLFHKIFKLGLFFAIIYCVLTQSLKQEEYNHIIRLILIITLAFIVIDCYYPTVQYE
jgi:positive regulator of sigma E activity